MRSVSVLSYTTTQRPRWNEAQAIAAHVDRHARCAGQLTGRHPGVSRLGRDVVLFHWMDGAGMIPGTTRDGRRTDGDGDRPGVRDGDRHRRGRGERGVPGEDL